MNYKNIKAENRENYAIIQIANNKNNSLDPETLKEIVEAAYKFNKIKEIKCIGITGNSKFFSPGADINQLNKLNKKKAEKIKLFSEVDKIKKIPIPILSFIDGYAIGGGLELALFTDFIIASDKAKFGLPEINLGLIPGMGGTQNLKKFLQNSNIKYLTMSGEIIDAEKAMKFGLISKIIESENFTLKVEEYLKNIASKPKQSLIILKRLINSNNSIEKGLKIERKEFYKLLDTDSKKTGINSFLNKTKPHFD
tara:strand:+ start:2626 stop:3384 length:759 start_codon:yes stop_codon:yes gene_type:complete